MQFDYGGIVLTHETGKSLVCSGDANVGTNFNQHVLVGVHEHLEQTGFVEWTVEKRQEALRS